MFKRAALLSALSALVFACSAGSADDGVDTSSDALTGSTIEVVFGGVRPAKSACFEKQYNADHMARHPKQTVTAIRVELTDGSENLSFEAEHGAKITFAQKGQNPKIRELSCELVNGKVLCTEDPYCSSSVELAATGTGLRMTNKDLRASGACDVSPKPLNATAGADDVFDLVPVSCTQGVLANPPTVDCKAVVMKQRACIDVIPEQCENMISKGERYADEFQMSAVEGKRLESAEECIQRFTDVVEETGCCGG